MLPAMQVLAGSVTAIDRDVRTITLGPTTFTVAPHVSLAGIDVGSSISVVYENFDGALVAVDLVRLPSPRPAPVDPRYYPPPPPG